MYLEKQRLDDRLAFVTGGGRGIGLASAEAMLEAGARVVISDIDPAVLSEGQAYLKERGHAVDTVVLDVAKSDDVDRVAAEVAAKHGTVDILLANAGIAWPDTGAEEMPNDVWLKVIDIDLNGCFWTCRAFAKGMLAQERGSIITIGSMSGIVSNNPQRQVHYNAAKAGVHQMTKSMAGEWAERGVRVNTIAPTYVDTAMSRDGFSDPDLMPTWMQFTPMKRVAAAEEIASVALFLAGEASSAMTGSVVVVDCGYTIW